jgi:hypothetical protein
VWLAKYHLNKKGLKNNNEVKKGIAATLLHPKGWSFLAEIYMKWYHWLGWLVFALSCIFDGYFFLTKYKKPISLSDEKDAVKISYMLQEEHGDAYIKDIRIGGNFPVTGLFEDLISLRYPNANLKQVKSIFYVVETDTTLTHYVTLFEIHDGFLEELVGKKLLTGKNYFFGLSKE